MAAVDGRTLVTGFLAFEGFEVNPSALLAQSCGRRFELVAVAYEAVDEFIAALDPNSFDRLLIMGVAGESSRMRIEQCARNRVGARSDVLGLTRGPDAIEIGAPDIIRGTIWTSLAFASDTSRRRPSMNAGEYLCNYIYWRALRRFEPMGKLVGFLHVPPLERMPLEAQQHELAAILELIENPIATR